MIFDEPSTSADPATAAAMGRTRLGLPARTVRATGVLAALASLTCAASMTLAGLGIGISAAATGMTGMAGPGTGTGTNGVLRTLLAAGPTLLIVSGLLITLVFAARAPRAALPALLATAILYLGMYAQPNLTLMYVSIALGYLIWVLLYLRIRHAATTPPKATE